MSDFLGECWNCHQREVSWVGDFTFEEFNLDGDGVVTVLKCNNCGADIEYHVPDEEEEE